MLRASCFISSERQDEEVCYLWLKSMKLLLVFGINNSQKILIQEHHYTATVAMERCRKNAFTPRSAVKTDFHTRDLVCVLMVSSSATFQRAWLTFLWRPARAAHITSCKFLSDIAHPHFWPRSCRLYSWWLNHEVGAFCLYTDSIVTWTKPERIQLYLCTILYTTM